VWQATCSAIITFAKQLRGFRIFANGALLAPNDDQPAEITAQIFRPARSGLSNLFAHLQNGAIRPSGRCKKTKMQLSVIKVYFPDYKNLEHWYASC
jgi:hypothetical protein